MYDGVDTVILNNELAYEDLLPVAFKPQARPLDAAAASVIADRNVRLLQVCTAIEEQGAVERKDEASPHSADLMRLEVKVKSPARPDGAIACRPGAASRPTLVRFNAQGATWKTFDPPRVGTQGLLEIWLRDSLPQPLTLIVNVTQVASDGLVKATLTPPGRSCRRSH